MPIFKFEIISKIREIVTVNNATKKQARAALEDGYQADKTENIGEPVIRLISPNPKSPKKNFSIKHFDDYHEIESKTRRAIELGCFPVAKHGYRRYFGLFYTGRHNKPTVEEVMQVLRRKVTFGDISDFRTGDVGMDEEAVRAEVVEALKNG